MPGTKGREMRRRDFLNGIRLAAGGAAVGSFFPMKAFASGTCTDDVDIDSNPNARRGGNLREVYSIGHWLRENRLSFSSSTVTLAAGAFDPTAGSFTILEDNGAYDVIIVGSGLSGLSAAFYLLQEHPTLQILILEGNGFVGGNATADEGSDLPSPGATAGAYAVAPYDTFLSDIYSGIGINWEDWVIPGPGYAHFFDEHTPYTNGGRGWVLDTFNDSGINAMPYDKDIQKSFHKAKQDFRNWYSRAGSPTDPADNSDPRYDYLSNMTLEEYLCDTVGCHPAVSDFYSLYAIDALAGQAHQVSAYTSISFMGSEYHDAFAFPGGNMGITRHLVKHLVPAAIEGSTSDEIISNMLRTEYLDNSSNNVRIRLNSMVLRAETGDDEGSVIYYNGGNMYRARAGAVILAGNSHTAKHLITHYSDSARNDAFSQLKTVPVVTANVVLSSARPLVELCPAYDIYWWGSRYWADAVVADWVSGDREDPDRRVVLTFYGGNKADPGDMPTERLKLLTTPFCDYEDSLREDLNRVFADAGFDFDSEVESINLYRWGHGSFYPSPGMPHGVPLGSSGQAVRQDAPRHVARAQIGRISLGGQDMESSPAVESAFGSGVRTAAEVLDVL